MLRILDRYIFREIAMTWLGVTVVLLMILLTNQFALVRFAGFGAARAAWPVLLIAAGAMLLLVARDRR